MSFRALLDREVTLIPREVTGTDGHGNDVVADGTPITGVPAGRDPAELSELTGDTKDLLVDRWFYFLPVEHDGAALVLDGHAELIDGPDRFAFDGNPDYVARRRGGKVHHIEALVYRTGPS